MDTKSRHTQQSRQPRYVPGTSRGTRSATTLLAQLAAQMADHSKAQELADIERGQRIRARREELHLTQPAVVDLLEAAALDLPPTHDLHPENAGKAPVTLRGYQTYEQGGGIVWEKAKLLAQVLHIDVQAMMHGEPAHADRETPSPFPDTADERIARMETTLTRHAQQVERLIENQNKLLARQSLLLESIEALVSTQLRAVQDYEQSRLGLDQAAEEARRSLQAARELAEAQEAKAPKSTAREKKPATR